MTDSSLPFGQGLEATAVALRIAIPPAVYVLQASLVDLLQWPLDLLAERDDRLRDACKHTLPDR